MTGTSTQSTNDKLLTKRIQVIGNIIKLIRIFVRYDWEIIAPHWTNFPNTPNTSIKILFICSLLDLKIYSFTGTP